jgi:lipoprotein-releasing system permease protein
MYKLLLCWRYLRTRYLALVCIISVMLGVATLIVVNSVMAGFSTKLKDRLHGLLSDVVVEAPSLEGFPDADERMEQIRRDPFLSDKIEAMTATLEAFAMLQYQYGGEMVTRPVRLIGIDPAGRARIGGFTEHLMLQKGRPNPSFELSQEAKWRNELRNMPVFIGDVSSAGPVEPGAPPPPSPPSASFREGRLIEKSPPGIIVGYAIASFRLPPKNPGDPPEEVFTRHPGDDVIITTVSGQKLTPVFDRFVVCDYFKSEMSEYDANYVFVPLDYLQHLRTMENRATSIQIKLHDYADSKAVVKALQDMFPARAFLVQTWEDKQGPLLAAIGVERGILNVLLFLIVGVAGFGILAIFSMIVVEKTRDIGILKALGASNAGVMKIFLGYGLLLGVVGAALGTGCGLAFTIYINNIEKLLGRLTGQDIFPRQIYYFDQIPTYINPTTVVLVNTGALAIAVIFSVLPALRAALLHPVRALRYE